MTDPTAVVSRGRWQRVALSAALAVVAGATALFWGGQREARRVDASADLAVSAEVTPEGTLEVREELVVTARDTAMLTRVLVAEESILFGGVLDGRGRPVDHTAVPVAEGLAVTVPLEDGAPAALELRYEVIGATSVGRDAVEVDWRIADDRNAVAFDGVDVELRWGAQEPAAIVDLEAPGAAPTVVSGDGALQMTVGSLPAHHDVEVHAALPLGAVPGGVAEDRSVMEDMAAAGAPGTGDRGGGPWWVPVLVAGVAGLVWALGHHRHGRDPEVGWPGFVVDRPSEHTPAELGWVLRRGVPGDVDVAATLADLLARGVVGLGPDGRWHARSGADRDGALQAHEAVLVRWLFDDAGAVTPDLVARHVAADPGRWRSVRRAFVAALEQGGRVDDLVPRRADAESVLGVGVAAAALLIAGVIGTAFGQPTWLLCVVVGAVGLVFSDSLAVVSEEGARLRTAWISYASWLHADEEAAARCPGHALVLGARGTADDARIAAAVTMADAIQDAFVAATSFVSAPRRRTPSASGRAVGS